jgi:hypothetical protein
LSIAARAVEGRLNADHSDHQGASLRCDTCHKEASYVGRRSKTLMTVLGAMKLRRAYYLCDSCKKGFCPRDRELGIASTSLSPAVTRMVGSAASLVSFKESHELLLELAGLHVETKQVERVAETLGAEIAADEQAIVEASLPSAPTLYLGVDGTGIPMRSAELEGRAGKQPDGSSKTREVKLCTVWTAETCDGKGVPIRDEGSVTYSAAIESAAQRDSDDGGSAFAKRTLREAERRGFDKATRQVMLGDGALWIWNLADEHFPNAIQIVDRFHAKENLNTVAKAVYGAGPLAPLRGQGLALEGVFPQPLTRWTRSSTQRRGCESTHRMTSVVP